MAKKTINATATATAAVTGAKLSPKEYILLALKKMPRATNPKTGKPYPGLHSVISGFNAGFKAYFGYEPDDLTRPANNKDKKPAGSLVLDGTLHTHYVKRGVMIYRAEDAPSSNGVQIAAEKFNAMLLS